MKKFAKGEKRRKDAVERRNRARRLQKIGRVTANVSSAFGGVAAGIAMGPDVGNITTGESIAKAVTGTGQSVSLSDDAKKKEEEEKKNVNNAIGNVSVDKNSGTSADGNTSGGVGGNNRGGSNSANGGGGIVGNGDNQTPKPPRPPKYAKAFATRLEQEKVFYHNKIDVNVEDENK